MNTRRGLDATGLDDFKPREKRSTAVRRTDEVGTWPSREPVPQRSRATEQLAMRLPYEDKELFDKLAEEGNLSKPQLLRRMIRAYQSHPDPSSLGK